MSNATVATETIRPDEAAHFGALAKDWWDPKGSSAMLHRLNPVRLQFIRDAIDAHFSTETAELTPLSGKSVLDIGCGAGLLCEPLARLGGAVTGVDAARENITAAIAHASKTGLCAPLPHDPGTMTAGKISYHYGELATLGLGTFDIVTCLEVIEHVENRQAFMTLLARHLAPGGLLVLSTPNRTPQSKLLLVEAAERFGMVPRGTHHWRDFITPDEMEGLMAESDLDMATPQGIAFSPGKGLHLSSRDLSLNYILTARHKQND
ncbi:MAG: bifunctional 2-polyprenyl-6-hydroxyphenol methylase/3-demethylubiquinol 3-O-methyltransferase UbiG [Sphingomonadaceae bacterium]